MSNVKENHSLECNHSFYDKHVRYNKKMSEKDALSEYGIRNCITVKKQG